LSERAEVTVSPPSDSRIHPRPQLQRSPGSWTRLDGEWKFRFDDSLAFSSPSDVADWPLRIQVPFAPETERSGIADTGFHPRCWYERDFDLAERGDGPLMLHFGAVDYAARVWVNGRYVGGHEGGHTPFSFDIAPFLVAGKRQTVTVQADDDPHDLAKPRGKQDWQREPHSIWYPRTSGIWQSVWIEHVPKTFIEKVRWTPQLERWEIGCEAFIRGEAVEGTDLKVSLYLGDKLLAADSYRVILGEVHRGIALSDPGIDDFRNELLWSPERPTLIRAELQLWRGGECLDVTHSYTALRRVALHADRFMLNGRPYFLRMILDQGYWPESFMTPPSDEAIRKDIELVKQMGFNGVRKHQKIEDPRFLYWADVMGLLVWEEMPSAYRFTRESVRRTVREWTEVIERDYSHPCIVVWVPFNESWGVPDLQDKAAHQHCVQTLYHLTKTLDSHRPVLGNDGWESTATDIIGIHDYDNDPVRLLNRYGPGVDIEELLAQRSPAGRLLLIEGYEHNGHPLMLTEFGGIAFDATPTSEAKNWGYVVARSEEEFHGRYATLLEVVNRIGLFAGFCYTQLTDTFQERNGLLYADRTPKLSLADLARATLGLCRGGDVQESMGRPPESALRAGSPAELA
jgi:beta-galactosidase/beta-glucuronidase